MLIKYWSVILQERKANHPRGGGNNNIVSKPSDQFNRVQNIGGNCILSKPSDQFNPVQNMAKIGILVKFQPSSKHGSNTLMSGASQWPRCSLSCMWKEVLHHRWNLLLVTWRRLWWLLGTSGHKSMVNILPVIMKAENECTVLHCNGLSFVWHPGKISP